MPEKINNSDATPQALPDPQGDARVTGDLQNAQALGANEVQRLMDAAAAKGYFGTSPDPTPREAYSVAGQLRAQPVPETDPAAAAQAAETARTLAAGEAPSAEADAAPKA